MKNVSKMVILLWCSLLAGIFVVSQVNVANGAWVNIGDIFDSKMDSSLWNVARLEKLYLSTTGNSVWILANLNNIKLLNWLLVHDGTYGSMWETQMSVVAWWNDNGIVGTSVWIVWWQKNYVRGEHSVVGGWSRNAIYSWVDAVIAWGSWNTAWSGTVVLWWLGNIGSVDSADSLVLWWIFNEAQWLNSLVLWSGAKWSYNTFLWKDWWSDVLVQSNSAYIWASGWVLIWTYQPKDGVSLVVSGAIRIWSSELTNTLVWEMMMTWWCFYVYDGVNWHILGKDSASGWSLCINSSINLSKTCRFGSKLLQEWDKVTAYSVPYSVDCDVVKTSNVSCSWWQLVSQQWSIEYIYPYCQEISDTPVVLWWNN